MQSKLISIITPSYNSSRFIRSTIESVLMQTYTNWEMLIVDDCSVDDSQSIILEYTKKDHRIKFIENEINSGAAISRNSAIKQAKGSYIAFLDSDDLWNSNKLKRQIEFMEINKYVFTYTYYDRISEDGGYIDLKNNMSNRFNYNSLIRVNKIGCLTVIYDVNYFGKVYMPLIRKRQDFGLWLSLLRKVDFAHCLTENLASYRVRAGSISNDKLGLIKYHWKLYRNIEKKSFFKSIYYLGLTIFYKIKSN